MSVNKRTYLLSIILCAAGLAGCATAPPTLPPQQGSALGAYHRIEKGQTLWRISKAYGVDIDAIIKVNRIADVTNIDVGQMILIPDIKPRAQIDKQAINVVNDDFTWPIQGKIIASFGQNNNGMVNKGINIAPFKHSDNVVAARGGKVVFYNSNFMRFGKTVIIDHGDGFSTVYSGNSQIYVKVGDNLRKGSVIGKIERVNQKGKNRYLHFQVIKGYTPQNPYFYLPR